MRAQLHTVNRAKIAARSMSHRLKIRLSSCQEAIAIGLQYRNWHELVSVTEKNSKAVIQCDIDKNFYLETETTAIFRISEHLKIPDRDIQHALAGTRLTGHGQATLTDQIEIRALCFRQTSLPLSIRRHPGEVGIIREAGYDDRIGILKSYGKPTTLITDGSCNSMCGDFEYISPRQGIPLFVPSRLYLPYGQWTESDGSIVLFSRDYKPLWRICQSKEVVRINPWDWINWDQQVWFWDYKNSPFDDEQRHQEEVQRLKEFGVVSLPLLVEALPILILDEKVNKVDGAVNAMERLLEPSEVGEAI